MATREREWLAITRGTRTLALALVASWLLVARLAAAGDATDADSATTNDSRGGTWASIGLSTGLSKLDRALADYQWDTSPSMAWGGEGLVGRGRLAAGMRIWSIRTTQSIVLPVGSLKPGVTGTSIEFVGQGCVATEWGTEVLATASVGRLNLGYDPDRLTIDVGGVPTEVKLGPIHEWIGGAGVALRRSLAERWVTGIGLERRIFGMDTAHRRGNAIVTGRDSFGDWSARFELAWRCGRS